MQTGSRVGRYELLEKLGQGGMAEVWKARNLAVGRIVAVKVLLEAFAQDPDLERRFLNEGRIQGRLHHPNVVAAFDADQDNGRSYLVMDYVDGTNLEARLEANGRKPLPIDEVLSISYDVLSALEYAHTLPDGPIVHRDLKPSNILLEKNRRARLADFGIAVALKDERKTKFGDAPGSVYYMSPEQITDPRNIDRRSDIYAFGCVLYEMLTGKPPFGSESDTDFNIRNAHVNKSPEPMRKRNPQVPFEFEWIVLKALNKDRDKRFASAAEMMQALKSAFPEPARSAPGPVPVGKKKRLVWAWLAVAILALAGIAGGLYYFMAPPPEQVVLRLHGSTTIGDELAPKLAEEFFRKKLGATKTGRYTKLGQGHEKASVFVWGDVPGQSERQVIEVYALGSKAGLKSLATSSCDIAMASSQYKAGGKDYPTIPGISENVIGLDGVAIVVNPNNTIEKLSVAQVRDIFSGKVTEWSQLGAGSGAIQVFVRDPDSGTRDAFKGIVMAGADIMKLPPDHVFNDSEALAEKVAQTPNSIGFVTWALNKGARQVPVYDGATAPLLPSPPTVGMEYYPITRRLYLYSHGAISQWARDFVDFAKSEDGQQVVKDSGFVPLVPDLYTVAIPADAPAEYRRLTEGAKRLNLSFRFETGQATAAGFNEKLDALAQDNVKRVLAYYKHHPGAEFMVLGFADSAGSAHDNEQLSLQRARAVRSLLQNQGQGLEVLDRDVAGFGSEMPAASNESEEGKRKNRRVEIWVRG